MTQEIILLLNNPEFTAFIGDSFRIKLQVFAGKLQGKTGAEIARELKISRQAVHEHLKRLDEIKSRNG